MNLQDQYLEDAANQLADEIDAEIMRGMLKECGWHEVILQWVMTHEVSQEVDDWVKRKTKGKYWNRGLVWMFEEERDANWFALKWTC